MLLSVSNAFCSSDKGVNLCAPIDSIVPLVTVLMCNTIRFAQADVAELAPHIIDALLAKIEKQGTPEKVAENDYLMKCLFSFRRQ